MTDALALQGGEKVLEIGAGSGYAAAVVSRIAGEVYTVERIGQLAEKAASVLSDLGYANVHVLHADGTLGWLENAPYDAIIVAAGGPDVPKSLKQQLKIGGHLVIPVGTDPRAQELVRVTRLSESNYRTEDIADVRFVPLVGEEGWSPEAELPAPLRQSRQRPDGSLSESVVASAEPFSSIKDADLGPLLARIGNARIVLLRVAFHGLDLYSLHNSIRAVLRYPTTSIRRRPGSRVRGMAA